MKTTMVDVPLIRILIVDDHPALRDGLRAMLGGWPGLTVVAEATTGEEAVAAYREHGPDVVLMDLQMPGMGGVAAITAIRAEWPGARIVVFTTYFGDAQALRALRAGASGYLLKSSLRQELLATIRSVFAGGKHIDATVASTIAIHAIEDALTEREIATLSLAAVGKSNREIGRHLGLSEETVKGHMKAIFSKLSAADRTHAVTIAARRGIIEL